MPAGARPVADLRAHRDYTLNPRRGVLDSDSPWCAPWQRPGHSDTLLLGSDMVPNSPITIRKRLLLVGNIVNSSITLRQENLLVPTITLRRLSHQDFPLSYDFHDPHNKNHLATLLFDPNMAGGGGGGGGGTAVDSMEMLVGPEGPDDTALTWARVVLSGNEALFARGELPCLLVCTTFAL